MCFLISIFLCFALVPKLVPRTVDFHWYWYRILKFWYRDNTSANNAPEHTSFSDQHAHERTNERKCIFYLNNVMQDVKMITASG